MILSSVRTVLTPFILLSGILYGQSLYSLGQGIQPPTLTRGPKLPTVHKKQKNVTLPIKLTVSVGAAAAATDCLKDVPASAPEPTKSLPSPPPDCVANQNSTCVWTAETWPFTDVAIDRNTGCLKGVGASGRDATVIVRVFDTKTNKAFEESLHLIVQPTKPTVKSASLATHSMGEPLSEHIEAFGGTGSFSFKLASGSSLPPGLSMDTQGNLTGVPTATGASSFAVIATDSSAAPSDPGTVTMLIDAATDCSNPKYGANYFRGAIPLSRRKNVNPQGDPVFSFPTQNDVVCFYGTSGQLVPLGQVQYLYGVGQGTNTISADMVSIQFPSPVGAQFSIGTSVTGGGSTNASMSTSSTAGQATPTTPAAALSTIEAGGNFYLHVLYPLYVYKNNYISLLGAVNGRFGFAFNGFAGQATLSQGTEQYVSIPAELLFNYNAIGNSSGLYADYRGGFQSVPGSFKTAAGLPSNVFGLQEASFGLNIAGLMRIGAQRYVGPAAAFSAPTSANFNKWQFVIQLSPTKGS